MRFIVAIPIQQLKLYYANSRSNYREFIIKFNKFIKSSASCGLAYFFIT